MTNYILIFYRNETIYHFSDFRDAVSFGETMAEPYAIYKLAVDNGELK